MNASLNFSPDLSNRNSENQPVKKSKINDIYENINREYTNHINLYFLYDTNIETTFSQTKNLDLKKQKVSTHSYLINMFLTFYKMEIQKFSFDGTITLFPLSRNINPLEMWANKTSFLKNIYEYILNHADYKFLNNEDFNKHFYLRLGQNIKNVNLYIDNSEGYSYNIILIFSDNMDKYNEHIYDIVNKMNVINTNNLSMAYGYIVIHANLIEFRIFYNFKPHFSRICDMRDTNVLKNNFRAFLACLIFKIYSKMKQIT